MKEGSRRVCEDPVTFWIHGRLRWQAAHCQILERGEPALANCLVIDHLGVTRIRPPESESSSIHSEPSGPSSTSRSLWPTSQRSAALAPPWPSKMIRVSVLLTRPLMKPLPFHWGKVRVPR